MGLATLATACGLELNKVARFQNLVRFFASPDIPVSSHIAHVNVLHYIASNTVKTKTFWHKWHSIEFVLSR